MLRGRKTYIVAALLAAAAGAHALGYLSDQTYQLIVGLLGAGAVATIRRAIDPFG